MDELLFIVTQEDDGGFCASAVGESICNQGDDWRELREMVLDATKAYFYDSKPPSRVRLHLDREEIIEVA